MTDGERDRSPDPNTDEDPLPDEAVVMRYGVSAPERLRMTALEHHDEHGDFAISVACMPCLTADDLARLGGQRHRKIRETTVGELREAGYDVVRDEPPEGHALIMLPGLPADEDFQAVSGVFGPPRDNPMNDNESEVPSGESA